MINLRLDGYGSQLSINNEEWFHISSITVMAGDDDCEVNDAIRVFGDNDQLTIQTCPKDVPARVPYRVRGEPAVLIHLDGETSGECFDLGIYHHKGTIQIKAERNQKRAESLNHALDRNLRELQLNHRKNVSSDLEE